ncbi:MAG: LysR family transcriptional regulator, partial [Bacilli bacterium]
MQHIDLKLLQTFVTVCACGSINKASTQLGYAQSTISTQISNLEKILQADLFRRENHSLILTQTGETVLRYAHRFLRLQTELQEELHANMKGHSVVSIAALESFFTSTIPRLLTDFNVLHPEIEISLIPGFVPDIRKKLITQEINFAILPSYQSDNRLENFTFYDETLLFVGKERYNSEEIKYMRLISLGSDCVYTSIAQSILTSKELNLKQPMNAFSVEGIKKLVMAGHGISYIPERFVKNELSTGKLIHIDYLPKSTLSAVMTYPHGTTLSFGA